MNSRNLNERVLERMTAAEPEQTREVFGLMSMGFAPSQIDRRMMLDSGLAHDVVVDYWATDKEIASEDRKAARNG